MGDVCTWLVSTAVLLFTTIFLIQHDWTAAAIIAGPQNMAAISGQSARLTCTSDNRTCDNVMWARTDHNRASVILHLSGQMIETYGDRYSVNVSRDGECCLDVTEVQESDAGLFTCMEEATESDQQTKFSSFLAVTESKPRLRMNKSHVSLNDSVTITCSISYHSDLNVMLTLTEASRTVDIVSSLCAGRGSCMVSATVSATKPQFGPFHCQAVFTLEPNNTNDELATNSVQLRSNVTPAVILQPAYGMKDIWLVPTSTTFVAGQTVRCMADGFPAPRYRWIRLPDNVEVSANDTLMVNESSSAHRYMCVASNVVNGKETHMYSKHIYFKAEDSPRNISSGSPVVIATVAVTGLCVVVVMTTTVCVNCLRRKYCHANTSESGHIPDNREAAYEVLRRHRTSAATNNTDNDSSSSPGWQRRIEELRHLPTPASRPDVTLTPSAWIEDGVYSEIR